MPAIITYIMLLSLLAISSSLFLTLTNAYTCYVASASDYKFPYNQWTWAYNCTACVRGKYVYVTGQSGTIWIWGCMTGSTGMISQGIYPGSWSSTTPVSIPSSSWLSWGVNTATNNNWASSSNWVGVVGVAWAGSNTWAGAGNPWSTWGGVDSVLPAQPFYNTFASMCIDGSFEGYSNSLGAYAYICTCCGDVCNLDRTCKTFSNANTLSSSSLLLLMTLTLTLIISQ